MCFIRLDPLYVYIVILEQYPEIPSLVILCCQINRYASIFLFSQWFLVSVKVLFMLAMTLLASILRLVQTLKLQMCRHAAISHYTHLQLQLNNLQGFEKALSTCGLSIIFIILIVSLNGIIFAWRERSGFLFIMAFLVGSNAVVVMYNALLLGCSIYENSVKILQMWSRQLAERKNCSYLSKVARSCQPLSLPAGNVGILDRDIKMNYFDKVVVYSVNVMVVIEKII